MWRRPRTYSLSRWWCWLSPSSSVDGCRTRTLSSRGEGPRPTRLPEHRHHPLGGGIRRRPLSDDAARRRAATRPPYPPRLKREIAPLYDELVKSLGLAKLEVSASPRHAGV